MLQKKESKGEPNVDLYHIQSLEEKPFVAIWKAQANKTIAVQMLK